jgi:putative RNA 2'-phosphotransferase
MSSEAMSQKIVRVSKFLSYVLRHKPEDIGIVLDANGWVKVDTLLQQANAHGKVLTRPLLEEVVATNSKQRFSFSEDGQKIRANQGHSTTVDLALIAQIPPETLYHGTARRFLNSIFATGLNAGNRHHVHLSANPETAIQVGQRHGEPVVLLVAAQQMHQAGHEFFCSDNGVWLTAEVAPQYLSHLAES